jgi:hypothetical protein
MTIRVPVARLMQIGRFRCLSTLFAASAVLLLASPAVGQARTGVVNRSTPRGPDGKPDLQGVWDFRTTIPLQRPDRFAGQSLLTAEQAAELEAQARQAPVDGAPPQGSVGAYNQVWFDTRSAVADRRTSLIVDPPNGRLPALVPGARNQIGSLSEDRPGELPIRYRSGGRGADDPEDRGLAERCLVGFNSGPPMLPGGYNQNFQLVQTTDHVVILNEMVHDARLVPLNGRPHLPGNVRQWMGDSRGRWDGDTLVVDTTNFSDKTGSFNPTISVAMGTGKTLHLTERFTRVDVDTLLYEYTVDDPSTFTRPFTVAMRMRRSDEPVFEYACHEGNYGLLHILQGGRAAEGGSR